MASQAKIALPNCWQGDHCDADHTTKTDDPSYLCGVGSRRGSGSLFAYKGTQMPFFPAEGFLLLLVGYLGASAGKPV